MGRFVFTLAVGVWLGTLVSFSFLFLPTIHAALHGEARSLLQRLFPIYHMLGIVCGLIALACVSLAPTSPTLPFGDRVRLAVPVAVALLCALATRQVLLPRMARVDSMAQPATYERLHRAAVMLNTTTMAMLVLVVAALTTR